MSDNTDFDAADIEQCDVCGQWPSQKAADTIATLQARVEELEEQIEKENFYARKQKAMRIDAMSKALDTSKGVNDAIRTSYTEEDH